MLVTTIVLIIALTVTLLSTNVPLFYNAICMVMGGERNILVSGDADAYMTYTKDYDTKEEALEAAGVLNEEIAGEAMVLMKNQNNALPLDKGANISVFGKNSVNWVYGGSGSAAGNSSRVIGLESALTSAGFNLNPTLLDFYNSSASGSGRGTSPSMASTGISGFATGETNYDDYTTAVKNSYSNYSDAALVVISRMGGEGWDLPQTMIDSEGKAVEGANASDHYLQLDNYETRLINEVTSAGFDKVIIIMNTAPQTFEMQSLEENTDIDGIIWAGATGENGINALGDILNGDINPSGKTVDTNPVDFKLDPTWNNFAKNVVDGVATGNEYTNSMDMPAYFVSYEEGIYSGYRYYETRGYTDTDTWYDENVVYPFGYGLSYTDFSYEIVSSEISTESDGIIEVEVEVTNNGAVDGKNAVQLYYSSPYTSGEIEKSHVMLGAYAKTGLIKANGGTETVTLTMAVEDMKSYDYNDANGNGFKGYELEKGTYNLYVSENAHSWADNDSDLTLAVEIANDIKYEKDTTSDYEVVNRFDDTSDNANGIDVSGGDKYLSRADWVNTWPAPPTAEEKAVDLTFMTSLVSPYSNYSNSTDEGKPWYVADEDMPTQASSKISASDATVKMYELVGKDYDDALWDDLLDQLTVEQMSSVLGYACYKTDSIDTIGKPATTDSDGPVGFTVFTGSTAVYDTFFYCSGVAIASTYNETLAFKMGEMVGNEGLLGNVKGDGTPYSGWFAPAANIHRSQFGGRNWEYMSEDGFISGMTSANIIQGASSKGVYTFMKHFAVNEQETNRESGGNVGGLITWASEQSMREIYFKPFELGVKKGGTTAIMSSFNRIGTEWAGGSYDLLTEILRNEWGFVGAVVTDFNMSSYGYMNVDQMIRAGGSTSLGYDKAPTVDATSATQVSVLRDRTKDLLYMQVNSCVMNGYGEGVEYRIGLPIWLIIVYSIDAILVVGFAVWGTLLIRKTLKKKKEQDINTEI